MICKPCPRQDCYELVEPLVFYINKKRHVVPAGFRFKCSVPVIFYRVLKTPFSPDVMQAACVHDYLYGNHLCTKEQADLKFKAILIYNGVSKETAETMYQGVKLFGHHAYNQGK